MNKVTLLGNLGADPEVRYTSAGVAVCNLRLATNERWKDKSGQLQERVEWHRVVIFGKVAETCGEYLKKGSRIMVEGSLRTRKWQDREGVDRYTTEIHGGPKAVTFLDRAKGRQAQTPQVESETQGDVSPEVELEQLSAGTPF